ncbi:MAG: hypothetical protein CUN55_12720 [Phototrophicales bacterium]|nr:MAG: hypothetical protein CUN55_12720 [Phototrophicales bacterium]
MWLLVRVGLVAAPIGGVWYVRNVLLGHAWTNLPPAYWQDFAQRSGMQLDTIWIFVTLTGLIAFIQLKKQKQWRHLVLVSLGILAINVAILPTLLSIPKTGWTWQTSWDMINGFREANRRLYAYEGFLLLFGVGALGLGTWPLWRQIPSKLRVGFLLTWALGLPFFLVYFWSFSYHYRLMLTVLPIMLAAIAALLAYLLNLYATNTLRRIALVVIAVFLGLPAPIAASFHTWHNTLDARGVRTETDKYRYANPALMDVVAALERYAKQQERDHLRVLAPGENRLAFFFPTWHIDDETIPTDLEDLNGYDVFVYSVVDFLWRAYDFYPNQVQAWTKIVWEYPLPLTGKKWAMDGPLGLPLPRFLRPIMTPIDDGTFHYELFAIDIHAPYTYIQPTYSEDERIYSTQMQLLGYDVPTMLFEGESYVLKFYWRGGAVPPQGDYSIFVHLTPPDDPTHILAQADGGFMVGAYPTRFLTPNMIFQDRRILHIPNNIDIQKAVLRVGVYDPATGIRFPILLEDGQSADSLTLQPILTLEDK